MATAKVYNCVVNRQQSLVPSLAMLLQPAQYRGPAPKNAAPDRKPQMVIAYEQDVDILSSSENRISFSPINYCAS